MNRLVRMWSTCGRCSLVALLIALNGCSLVQISEQAEFADTLATVRGRVDLQTAQQGVVTVALYRRLDTGLEAVRTAVLVGDSDYEFPAEPGSYVVGAFVDVNSDGSHQDDEHASYVGAPDPAAAIIELSASADVTLAAIVIEGPIAIGADLHVHDGFNKAQSNTGRIASLGEPMFSFESAKMGLWRPVDFFEQYGGGLMLLQPFDASTMPVVFVHGISGSARSFEKVIQSLDRRQFQPWVFQYPSGVRLHVISEYLQQSLDKLYEQYEFPRIMLVAHSMGGLMARSFVMKHVEGRRPYRIALGVTINSPLQGVESAIIGVRTSPVVVPVWRDMASNSDYVRKVNEWQWPKSVPYHLIFSYLPDEASDGVVPLKSQLSLSLQDQAVAVHGFQAEHTALLADPEFSKRLHALLSRYRTE